MKYILSFLVLLLPLILNADSPIIYNATCKNAKAYNIATSQCLRQSFGVSILTSGTTFTTPATSTLQTFYKITLVGGGGGGGANGTGSPNTASGAGSGAVVILWVNNIAANTVLSLTIGAAGTGGVAGTSTAGTSAGSTSITIAGTTYTAGGGTGGASSANGPGGSAGTATNTFGSIIAGLNLPGQPGSIGTTVTSSGQYAMGGNTALFYGNTSQTYQSGPVTSAGFGAGGQGGFGNTAGSNGAPGIIIIEYWL